MTKSHWVRKFLDWTLLLTLLFLVIMFQYQGRFVHQTYIPICQGTAVGEFSYEEWTNIKQGSYNAATQLKKYKGYIKKYYETANFKEPVVMLIRRSGKVEFYENASSDRGQVFLVDLYWFF